MEAQNVVPPHHLSIEADLTALGADLLHPNEPLVADFTVTPRLQSKQGHHRLLHARSLAPIKPARH